VSQADIAIRGQSTAGAMSRPAFSVPAKKIARRRPDNFQEEPAHARVYSKYGRGILLGIPSPESKNSETSQVVFSS
jgi:hypothetical protein